MAKTKTFPDHSIIKSRLCFFLPKLLLPDIFPKEGLSILFEMAGMGSKVGSTGNVLGIQDCGPDNEAKLRGKVNYLKHQVTNLLTTVTSELTSGKMSKTEWLTDVENTFKEAENLESKLAEGRFKGYEASVRDLLGKMKELDELYNREVKLAESLVVEENAGEANEGGKMSVVGMGGVGKVRLENKEAVNMTFGEISVAEENAGEKRPKKKNSSKTVTGMGGVGDTDIKNEGPVTMTFGNISI